MDAESIIGTSYRRYCVKWMRSHGMTFSRLGALLRDYAARNGLERRGLPTRAAWDSLLAAARAGRGRWAWPDRDSFVRDVFFEPDRAARILTDDEYLVYCEAWGSAGDS